LPLCHLKTAKAMLAGATHMRGKIVPDIDDL
jgi:hypothetical protein